MASDTAAMFFDLVLGDRDDVLMALGAAANDFGLEEVVLAVAGNALDVAFALFALREGRVLRYQLARLPVAVGATGRRDRGFLVVAVTAGAAANLDAGFGVARHDFFVVARLALFPHQRGCLVRAVTASAVFLRVLGIVGSDRPDRAALLGVARNARGRFDLRGGEVVAREALAGTAGLGRSRVQGQALVLVAVRAPPRFGGQILAGEFFVTALARHGLGSVGVCGM